MWLNFWRSKNANDIKGYENGDLVGLIVRRTAVVRDAPRIDDPVPGELLIPTLVAVAAAKAETTRVLDFGGAAGLHYLAANDAFPDRALRWAVIETPAMVEAASPLADGHRLRFFTDIAPALSWLEGIDVMHSVSALQYIAEPEAKLDQLIGLQAPVVYWGKLMLGEHRETVMQSSRLRDNGPGELPIGIPDRKVSYRATRIERAAFLEAHRRGGYRLAWKARDTDSYLFARA
jgi:putative methyltransferase (TIGR04325 family)